MPAATAKWLRGAAILAAPFLFACATLRSNALLPIDFTSQPPRAIVRGECSGVPVTTQGVIVCEQKTPSTATISVKVPPLEGRVVYSNGQLKRTDDFNWYPKEGFFLWKKQPIKDTWLDLDLGEIAATFGDWPVALDVMAVSSVGAVVTRGILYHRICNDQDISCSRLVVEYECAGAPLATGVGQLGKCERLAGSAQAFSISLQGARAGAKAYVLASRLGVRQALDVTADDLKAGFRKVELPPLPAGPTLVDFALDWFEGTERKHLETKVLIMGFDPSWTGLDRPHYLDRGEKIDFARPVLADLFEVDLYDGRGAVEKHFGTDKVLTLPRPRAGQIACAFAWSRDASDLTSTCLDQGLKEVPTP